MRHLHLTAAMYASLQLKRRCELNCNRVYVPGWLLQEWGMTVDADLSPAA